MRLHLLNVRWLAVLLAAAACAPASVAPSASTDRQEPAAPGPPRTLVLAQINSVPAYGPWEFSNTSGGGASLAEIHTMGLVTQDDRGSLAPRLVTSLPSLDDGSIEVLPDGTMRTTWKLRGDVTWQDGTRFTAADVAFSVAVHTGFPSSITAASPFIQRVETPDPLSAVITWKTTFYNALDLNHRALWLLPKHILGEELQQGRDRFLNLPYFTTEYVHLGPFRLVDWGMGENEVFERYDGYFLGRPKVERIIIRSIPNPVTILTNLRAGTIDIAAEKTLLTDIYIDLRDEWKRTGEGTLLQRQENWRYIWFQFDAQWARPVEISQDVRVRRAFAYAWDREALRELILPGLPNTSADTFMEAIDPRAPVVGTPFARYRYEPSQALQELAEVGWRQASDGRLLNQRGEQVEMELRGNAPDVKELAVIADGWRRLGVEVKEYIPPESLGRDAEFKSKFPGVETRARGNSDGIFSSFDGRLSSGPQNRWQGANTSHYSNPALDRLIDKLYSTLDLQQQSLTMKEMGEILATDLPALPMYFRVSFMTIRNTVRGPIYENYPNTRASGGAVARNAHLWDRA